MIRWLYDLGFLVFGAFSLPHFLLKLRQAEDPGQLVRERLGLLSHRLLPRLGGRPCLWIHSVSVGEVLAVEKFIQFLLSRKPDLHIVLTTVTPTGQRTAKPWEQERLSVLYFPFDVRFAVRRFFETFKPLALLLVETEIWPNVIEEARRGRVPIGVINGRLSERSFRSFRRFALIFKPLLQSIDFFLVQTDRDRDRLTTLGVDAGRVKVTGNMKMDAFEFNGRPEEGRESLREKWGYLSSDQILVAGSTHPGEEEILFRTLHRLREEHFPLKLLLAPRHIERSSRILEQAKKHGFEAVLASRAVHAGPSLPSFPEVQILDRLGELRRLYPLADAVFMGGSLVRRGGQNPIEPVSSRRPIIHGPWVFNFHEIYQRLDEEGGSLRVHGEEELQFVLRRILASERERRHLGDRAYEVLKKLRGATERNFHWVEEFVKLRNEPVGSS